MNDAVRPLIAKSGAFQDVLKCIRGGQLPCSVFGVTPHAKPYFAEAAAKRVTPPLVFGALRLDAFGLAGQRRNRAVLDG